MRKSSSCSVVVATAIAATSPTWANAQYVNGQGGPRSQTQQNIATWCAIQAKPPIARGNIVPMGSEEAAARYRQCKIRNRIN
jgi:hypothetical protein